MINRKNVDDIFLRSATISVMKKMEDVLVLDQVENGKIVKYNIPVFYNKAQDSQFMQDYFTDYDTSCHKVEFADGDYDQEPFAIVTADNISVKMSDITNKFVRGNHILYTQDANGYDVKKGYSSVLYALPIEVKYSVEIRTEDTVQSFRVIESILNDLFKNNVIHFDYKGSRIRCNMSLDSSFTHDKKLDFGYTDDQSQKIKFSIDLECYYPVFDDSTTLFRGNVIRNFRQYIEGKNESYEKETVTYDENKDMKIYSTTRLISSDEIEHYNDLGYVLYDTKDFDLSEGTYKTHGPFIINNREVILVKDLDENN